MYTAPSNPQSGTFRLPGLDGINLGVSVANTLAYSFDPVQGGTIIPVIAVQPAEGYTSLATAVAGRSSLVILSSSEAALKLDCPRGIQIAATFGGATGTLGWIVSGYDRYMQPMVWADNMADATADKFSPRAFAYITSIYLHTIDDATDITINSSSQLELAFTDAGNGANTIVINDGNRPSEIITLDDPVTAGGAFNVTRQHTYVAANWTNALTATTGTVRPLYGPVNTTEWNDANPVTVMQAVYGIGNGISYSNPVVPANASTNTSVIGIAQYAVGWTGWKG